MSQYTFNVPIYLLKNIEQFPLKQIQPCFNWTTAASHRRENGTVVYFQTFVEVDKLDG